MTAEPRSTEAAAVEARAELVAAAFAALDASGIPWALLRGTADGSETELDLLLAPERLAAARETLRSAGWRRLPAWNHPGHTFFVAYTPRAGRLSLDVVTDVAFGAGRRTRLGDGGPVLARRRRAAHATVPDAADAAVADVGDAPIPPAEAAVPDAADAFWLRLLHAILDRGALRDSDRDALRRAGDEAGDLFDSPIVASLEARSPGAARRLVDAWRRDDLPALLDTVRELDRAGGPAVRIRGRIGRAIQAVPGGRKAHAAIRRPGLVVALLGPDGAGKSSLSAALAPIAPIPVRSVYLGLYQTGGRGPARVQSLVRVARVARARLIAVYHSRRGRLVVLDRHPIELDLNGRRRSFRRRVRAALLSLLAPRPDLVVVLDAPGSVLFARKGEHDPESLEEQRRRYADLAARRGALLVDATQPADAVARTVAAATWSRLADRWDRG